MSRGLQIGFRVLAAGILAAMPFAAAAQTTYSTLGEAVAHSLARDAGRAVDESQLLTQWVEETRLTASDADPQDEFGFSVALSGDTALIGALHGGPSDLGAAYVFVRSGSGWSEQAQLLPSQPALAAGFGVAVALEGDTALIGAPNASEGGHADQGAAYVFTRSGTTWTQQAVLLAADGTATDLLGWSVALDGDTALAAAPFDRPGGNIGQGSAYVFTRSGTTWSQQAKLIAANGQQGDQLGDSQNADLDGDTAVLGARGASVGNTNQGAGYVFTRSGTTWSQQAKLIASDGAAGDNLGSGVGLSGDTVVVGASSVDVGQDEGQGAGYVFTRSGTTWSEQAKLTAAFGAAGDGLGQDVTLLGDLAVLGAPPEGDLFLGSAHVFVRDGTTWSEQAQLVASDAAFGDRFGFSVAADGDTILIGASGVDLDGDPFSQHGAAYVFTLEPQLRFNPASLNFGEVEVDSTSEPMETTLTNVGDVEALGLGFSLPNGDFDVDTSNCGDTLPPGASCVVSVRFAPQDIGLDLGAMQATAAGGRSNTLAMAGEGFEPGGGPPQTLAFDPAILNFGGVEIGGPGVSLMTTLTNTGDSAANGLVIAPPGGDFGIASNCGTSLPSGASCTVDVTFTPASGGLALGTLQAMADDAVSNPVVLGGNGLEPDAPEPVLVFDPTGLDFQGVMVGSTSVPQSTTLTNVGESPAVNLSFSTLGGGFAANTADCADGLAPGESCEVSITFEPLETGAAVAALEAADAGGAASNFVLLAGNGVEPGPGDRQLRFAPASLNFGDIDVADTGGPLITNLINTGSSDATDLSFDTPGSGFTLDTDACGPTLPAGGSCPVSVFFTPAATGMVLVTVEAESAEGLTSNPLVLGGNGIEGGGGGPAETLQFSPVILNFDNVDEGDTSPSLTTTLTNIGSTTASGLSFDLPANGFIANTDDCPPDLAAGASCDVSVTFTPAAIGLAIDALQASADGAISNPVVLAGNGVEPGDPNRVLVFDPTSLDFGDVALGTVGPTLTTTLTNTGSADATGLAFNAPGSGFAIDTSDCGTSLAAGASCTVEITFVPPLLGPLTAALEAGSAEGLSSNFVILNGRGVDGGGGGEPMLVFEPASLDFGPVPIGEESVPLTTSLFNGGDGNATGLGFTLDGEDFDVDTSACGSVLIAGTSCPVTVVFIPSQDGPVAATLTAGSAEGVTAVLDLTGGDGTEGLIPLALIVDAEEVLSDGNNVFEPGERVEVAPEWFNDGSSPEFLAGTASGFTGPQGPDYTLVDDGADYGEILPGQGINCRETGDCYEMEAGPSGVPRPSLHWDTAFDETLSDPDSTEKPWVLHIGDSFLDVPRNDIFYFFIETLLHHSVTTGCTSTTYCPGSSNTRAQMSVFVLKSLEGPAYQPPACDEGNEMFTDVAFDNIFCPWIEELAGRGVVAGCGGNAFCPNDAVTRAQMSIFLLRTLLGSGYAPPPCTGEFIDVPCASGFAAWIEDLSERQITAGCIADPPQYCPSEAVSRGQMAVFLTRTFGLLIYGP